MASRIVGVSLRQIQYWDERVCQTLRQAGSGTGHEAALFVYDLLCLKLVKDRPPWNQPAKFAALRP
jgi:hypothetical protein